MSFFQKMLWIVILAVVLVGLNLVGQKIFPTNSRDVYGRRVAYRFLIYFLFLAALGVAAILGHAFG